MTYIAKSPLEMVTLSENKDVPIEGTRGLYAKEDGWYDVDSNGETKKIADVDSVDKKLEEKQDALTFDAKPTRGSGNPVMSDGLFAEFDRVEQEISSKAPAYILDEVVYKEDGKGLSANDYTDADKSKVDNLPKDTLSEIDLLETSKADKADIDAAVEETKSELAKKMDSAYTKEEYDPDADGMVGKEAELTAQEVYDDALLDFMHGDTGAPIGGFKIDEVSVYGGRGTGERKVYMQYLDGGVAAEALAERAILIPEEAPGYSGAVRKAKLKRTMDASVDGDEGNVPVYSPEMSVYSAEVVDEKLDQKADKTEVEELEANKADKVNANGAAVVYKDDWASGSNNGVVRTSTSYGTMVDGDGYLRVFGCTAAEAAALTSAFRPIMPVNFPPAFEAAAAKSDTAEQKANRGAANGYAPLDENGKLAEEYLYGSVDEALEKKADAANANGAAVVYKDDFAASGNAGVIKLSINYGGRVDGDGYFRIYPATEDDAKAFSHQYRPIVPANFLTAFGAARDNNGCGVKYFVQEDGKITLERGCLYCIQSGNASDNLYVYDSNGNVRTDSEGNTLSNAKWAIFFVSDNQLPFTDGNGYGDFMITPTTLSITSQTFYCYASDPDITIGCASRICGWKMKI